MWFHSPFLRGSKFHIISCGEAVDVFQGVPKLPLQISKSMHVHSQSSCDRSPLSFWFFSEWLTICLYMSHLSLYVTLSMIPNGYIRTKAVCTTWVQVAYMHKRKQGALAPSPVQWLIQKKNSGDCTPILIFLWFCGWYTHLHVKKRFPSKRSMSRWEFAFQHQSVHGWYVCNGLMPMCSYKTCFCGSYSSITYKKPERHP